MALRYPVKSGTYDRRFGTHQRDFATGSSVDGEVDQNGEPLGSRDPMRPGANDAFFAGARRRQMEEDARVNPPVVAAAPRLAPYILPNAGAPNAGAPAVGRITHQPLPQPVSDAPLPPSAAPAVPAQSPGLAANPAPSFPRPSVLVGSAQPDTDQIALIHASDAYHEAARHTAPIPLPEGDPAARAFWAGRGMGNPAAPAPTAPASRGVYTLPDRTYAATLAGAGIGTAIDSRYGTAFARIAAPAAPAVAPVAPAPVTPPPADAPVTSGPNTLVGTPDTGAVGGSVAVPRPGQVDSPIPAHAAVPASAPASLSGRPTIPPSPIAPQPSIFSNVTPPSGLPDGDPRMPLKPFSYAPAPSTKPLAEGTYQLPGPFKAARKPSVPIFGEPENQY